MGNALESYKQAIQLTEPAVPPRYLLRLGIAQMALFNETDAERSFQQALANDEGFAPAHYELGKLYLRQRKFVHAEHSLERALMLDPYFEKHTTLTAWPVCGTAKRKRDGRCWRAISSGKRSAQDVRSSELARADFWFWAGLIACVLATVSPHSDEPKQPRLFCSLPT